MITEKVIEINDKLLNLFLNEINSASDVINKLTLDDILNIQGIKNTPEILRHGESNMLDLITMYNIVISNMSVIIEYLKDTYCNISDSSTYNEILSYKKELNFMIDKK